MVWKDGLVLVSPKCLGTQPPTHSQVVAEEGGGGGGGRVSGWV